MSPVSEPRESSDPKTDRYREVEVVRDPDGVIAVITEHVKDGAISFAIFREFERNGVTTRGAFMARRHLPAVQRMLADLEERIELAEDRARAKRRER